MTLNTNTLISRCLGEGGGGGGGGVGGNQILQLAWPWNEAITVSIKHQLR